MVGKRQQDESRMKRSLSRDSFSTFTTASAETPDGSSLEISSESRVIVWGDERLPFEICLPEEDARIVSTHFSGRLQKARPLPDPPFLDDDDHNQEEEQGGTEMLILPDAVGSKNPQVPESEPTNMPSFFANEFTSPPLVAPALKRSASGGLDYLSAPPERFTRFEI